MGIKKFLLTLTAASAILMGTSAYGDMVMFEDSIDRTMTDWDDNLTIPAFDTTLGTLTSVTVKLTGEVFGAASYESLDSAAADITLDLEAGISVEKPGGGLLAEVFPLVQVGETAAAFDGTIDFGGTSGNMFGDIDTDPLTGMAMDTVVLTSPADLALFTGMGDLILAAFAEGSSTGSGAGNLITQFNTDAAASVKVTYEFRPDTIIPEPASLSLLGLGGLALMRRRRASKA